MADYSREQIYDAMRKADAAGDADAVKALAAALKGGATKQQIIDQAAQNNLSVDEAALDANIASRDAGGPTNTFLEPKPSMLKQLGTATENAVAGAAQGVAGLYDFGQDVAKMPTQAMNVVTRGIADLIDLSGIPSVGGFLRRGADNYDRDLSAMPSVASTIEQASPTPEGMGAQRFVAQLLGGAAVPFGPKAKAPVKAPAAVPAASGAAETISAGRGAGVRVMTSDVRPPKTFIGRLSQATGERIPIAGTAGPRARQQAERVEAVKDIARDFGADVASDQLNDVADDLAKTRGGMLSKLKATKDAVIQGITAPFTDAPRTVFAIDREIARLKGIDEVEYAPVVQRLERFKTNLTSGKSLEQVEGNRKLLGDMFADPTLAQIKGEGQKAINRIYAPLRDDMSVFISRNTTKERHSAWKKANDSLSSMAGELKSSAFKKMLNDAETTPENVATLLFNQKPSEVRRLIDNLSPRGRSRAQSAVIQRAIEKAGGIEEVSPDKFANEIARLGKPIGVIFQGGDLARIRGLERVLQATKRAAQASVTPPTGVQNTPIVGGYAAGSLLGAAAIPYAAFAGFASRAYESAAVRDVLVGLSKTKPGSKEEGALLSRIAKMVTSQLEIQGGGLTRAANENVPMGQLAASDEKRQQQQ